MEISIGSIVRSKAGRDKGGCFVVVASDGEYAYLADGRLRKAERPKKKKLKHIQVSDKISGTVAKRIAENCAVTNAEVRKALSESVGTAGTI